MNKHSLLSTLVCLLLTACAGVPSTPAVTPTPTFAPERYASALLDVPYCTPDGLEQTLDAYFPASGGPWPAVVWVHGGGWVEGDKAEGAGWRSLNDQGYLVISVNYRLAAYDIKFPAMIEDVKCAIRYLRAHAGEYNLDPERIGVMGASAGGHLVALLGTADASAGWDDGEYADQSSRVQAVVSMAGVMDFTLPMYDGIAMAIYYASGELGGKDSEANRAASPVTYVTPDDPPFLILHGDEDGVVPLDQATALHDRLTEAGVPSTLVIVRNGDHSLRGLNGAETVPTQDEIYAGVLAFLEANLKK
jgi:acetyl esterase/lipase